MRNRASPKNKKDQAKRDTITSIVFLSLVVIGILIAFFYSSGVFHNLSGGDRKINMDTGKVVKEVAGLDPGITENPNISYPGYGEIRLKADTEKQDVYLYNPKDNTCYFRMSIILEDGRVIWQSDNLEPGNAFDRIELSEVLGKGTYGNAVLKYDSYSIKDGRQLNGSSINFTATLVNDGGSVTAADALTEDAKYNLVFAFRTFTYSFTYKKETSGFTLEKCMENSDDATSTYSSSCTCSVDGPKIIFKLTSNLTCTIDTSANTYKFTGGLASETTFTSFSVKPAGGTDFTEVNLTAAQ